MAEKKSGFTFIELVIAISLLAIGVFPVLQLFTYSLSTIHMTRTNVTAVNLANEALEMAKNMNLSVDQWILMDTYVYPKEGELPLVINGRQWKFAIHVMQHTRPLPIEINVYEAENTEPVVKVFTLFEDLY